MEPQVTAKMSYQNCFPKWTVEDVLRERTRYKNEWDKNFAENRAAVKWAIVFSIAEIGFNKLKEALENSYSPRQILLLSAKLGATDPENTKKISEWAKSYKSLEPFNTWFDEFSKEDAEFPLRYYQTKPPFLENDFNHYNDEMDKFWFSVVEDVKSVFMAFRTLKENSWVNFNIITSQTNYCAHSIQVICTIPQQRSVPIKPAKEISEPACMPF